MINYHASDIYHKKILIKEKMRLTKGYKLHKVASSNYVMTSRVVPHVIHTVTYRNEVTAGPVGQQGHVVGHTPAGATLAWCRPLTDPTER